MARKLRVEYPGTLYHVMNRGDRREPIFKDDLDRRRFLETLGQTCDKTGWQVHAIVSHRSSSFLAMSRFWTKWKGNQTADGRFYLWHGSKKAAGRGFLRETTFYAACLEKGIYVNRS